MKPAFSIILITHKRIDYLKRAIVSIQNQTFKDFEVLIMNDWPVDNDAISYLVKNLHDSRFLFIPSEQPKGANFWRNYGIFHSKGEYIAFLDDDDRWFPEKLSKHYYAHTHENAFLVYSDYIKTWPHENCPDLIEDNAHLAENLKKAIVQGHFSISTTSSVSIKNERLGKLFDESLQSFQDWDAWFTLVLNIPTIRLFRIEQPLLYFTQHEGDRVSKNYHKRNASLIALEAKYKAKNIDITPFVYKQKLNLIILIIRQKNLSKIKAIFQFLQKIVNDLKLLSFSYTYKRIGIFLIKNR